MMRFDFHNNIDGVKALQQEISDVALLLWERGWSEKSASNLSVQIELIECDGITETAKLFSLSESVSHLAGKSFYITGSGTRMLDVSRNTVENGVVILINNKGDAYYELSASKVKPSSELASHLAVHDLIAERNSAQKVVVHTHATELITLTQYNKIKNAEDLNKLLWAMQPGTMYFIPDGVGYVPYTLPGTQHIAKITRESFINHDIVVWQKHGAFAIGENLSEAFDSIDIICKSAKIWLQCKAAGFEPSGLTDEEIEELRKVVKSGS